MPFQLDFRLKLSEVRKKTMLRHLRPNFSSAFTLIELLVVISIIGILASLATFSYTDSQKKSRDSRRKSDLVAIQKALELAKQDTAGNYSYPLLSPAGPLTTTQLPITYIKAIPTDPKTDVGYKYTPMNSTPAACAAVNTCVTHSLVACLENTKDPQKDGSTAYTASGCTTGASYTITNL